MKHELRIFGLALLGVSAITLHAGDFDWPQWQGANRDAVSDETGLLQAWPEGGPALAWKVTDVGGGYGAPSVAQGRLFGMSNREEGEVVWALSEKDGSEVWVSRLGATQAGGMRQGIEGVGCTPTVDGERLYVLGHGGDLACLKVADGEILWQRNLIKDFGGKLPTWRYNESPLVDGAKVICTPGGDDATLVALDKMTGEEVWRSKMADDASAAGGGSGREPGGGARRPSESETREEVAAPAAPVVSLIATESKWRYLDTGVDPGAEWAAVDFKDAGWSEGAAQLGYGDRDEATQINSARENFPTYYFRHAFEVDDPGKLKPLVIRVMRDDGAVVYLNGREVMRDNMPAGPIRRETLASGAVSSESGYFVHELGADQLVAGRNVIAVEIHQSSAESSDVSFDLELREKIAGKDVAGAPPAERRRRGGGFGGRGFGNSGAGYSSAIAIEFEGVRQYVQFTSKAVVGIGAADGKLLWSYDKPSNRSGINCSTPIYHDGHVFAASAYGAGGGLVKLSKDGEGGIAADEVWFSSEMENHHGGVMIHGGALYGANGGNGGGALVCLDLETGEVLWDEGERSRDERRAPKGSVAMADGRLYYRTEGDGAVLLIEPSRDGYVERGRFEQPDRTRSPAWTHPVVANGKLYVRDQDLLLCYNIKGE